jgi:hypothetical protein
LGSMSAAIPMEQLPGASGKEKCLAGSLLRRKKASSANKDPTQRHSVEVTSSPWLHQNTNPKRTLEELDFLSEMKLTGSQGDAHHVSETNEPPKVRCLAHGDGFRKEESPTEKLPVAVSALRSIWNHVKSACAEAILKDTFRGSGNSIDGPVRSSTVKLRKDRKVSRAHAEARKTQKKEKPRELQSIGRSFLLGKDQRIF